MASNHTLCLWGPKPKCFTASLAFFGPLNNSVLLPVGALRANWSKVNTSPPLARIRARAVAVNRRAAMFSFGTVRRRLSSVTVPTMTMVLLLDFSDVLATILERDTGGRLMRDMKRRRRMTLLKAELVRPAKQWVPRWKINPNPSTYGLRSDRVSRAA
jgi:hypothetical protein